MEIENKASAIRAAIKKAKAVYVMNPLTEGYVKVYKNDLLLDIAGFNNDTEMSDNIYIRFGDDTLDLYIN